VLDCPFVVPLDEQGADNPDPGHPRWGDAGHLVLGLISPLKRSGGLVDGDEGGHDTPTLLARLRRRRPPITM
jgi:hypothetical protein